MNYIWNERESDEQYEIDGGKVIALLMMVSICIVFWVGVIALIVHMLN